MRRCAATGENHTQAPGYTKAPEYNQHDVDHLKGIWVDEPLSVDRPFPLQQVKERLFIDVHPSLHRGGVQLRSAQQAIAVEVQLGKYGGEGAVGQHAFFVDGCRNKGGIVEAAALAQVQAAAHVLHLVAVELHARFPKGRFHVLV